MKEIVMSDEGKRMIELCQCVHNMMRDRNYEACNQIITDEMKSNPHAPEPHNLLGLLLEKQNNHLLAMKHFRAAWALDPTYLPPQHNLEVFGHFTAGGVGAFEESDCPVINTRRKWVLNW